MESSTVTTSTLSAKPPHVRNYNEMVCQHCGHGLAENDEVVAVEDSIDVSNIL